MIRRRDMQLEDCSKWRKYNCDLHGGYYELNESGWSMSDGQFIMDRAGNYGFVLYTGYEFSSSSGLYGTGETIVYPPDYAINKVSEMNDLFSGKYVVDSTIAYRYDSIDSIENGGGGYYVSYSYTVLATADYIDISYSKGSVYYGTVTTPIGKLPEGGTLVAGSFDAGYCVLQIGSIYYYYELEV